MRINKKNLSIIILTLVFVISVVITIIIGNIKVKPTTPTELPINQTSVSSETEVVQNGGTTATIPTDTKKPVSTGTSNVLDGIMGDIYDNNRPVIINPAYGNNVNTGADGYELEGTAVTTVYDTVESTKNGETTKPEPETTTAPQTAEPKKTAEETTGSGTQAKSVSPK